MSFHAAIARSARVYLAGAARRAALDRWYARFIGAGELAFDVGAHVGDRAACFARLGARVVALEPQPAMARFLRLAHRRVRVVQAAAGAQAGRIVLHVNAANPTVSTASRDFLRAADGASGWQGQVWNDRINVPVTTLRALIARFGEARFVKIDVEGFEHAVLAGLPRPVRTLSFEFTTIQRDVAFALPHAVGAAAMRAWLAALPIEANSGDVYASLESRRLR